MDISDAEKIAESERLSCSDDSSTTLKVTGYERVACLVEPLIVKKVEECGGSGRFMDRSLIEEAAERVGIFPTSDLLEKTKRFIDVLLEANQFVNLTAITEPAAIATRHLQDSWTPARFIAEGASVIDVGTGAGFPGIPLRIARPDLNMTLIDASAKRVHFLERVIQKIFAEELSSLQENMMKQGDLDDIDFSVAASSHLSTCSQISAETSHPSFISSPIPRVIHGRAEELGRDPDHREKYDVAIARAVTALPVLAEYCLPFVQLGGLFIAMKGLDDETEEAERAIHLLGGVVEEVYRYKLPEIEASFSLVIVRKKTATSLRYPRRMAAIKRRPL
ncbi:MAG: 16S rRNA (guanine(527)-N(7))-methyltransferase RsmG [Clostridiaceae bacterium]|nr:16S rRNA (guanine(527)-N(7))-methyltransferase RsmG [Clostridiaceae bacterium]